MSSVEETRIPDLIGIDLSAPFVYHYAVLKHILRQTLLGLLIVNLAFPPQANAASWFQSFFRSSAKCVSTWWHQGKPLVTIEDQLFVDATRHYGITSEVFQQMQMHQDVILQFAKKTCGSEFCNLEDATEVLRKVVDNYRPKIESIRVENPVRPSEVVRDYLDLAMPWMILAAFDIFTGSVAKGAGDIALYSGGAFLMWAIGSAISHRRVYDTQQRLKAFFDTLPDNSPYWEKLRTANGGPTYTKQKGTPARKIRMDVLAMHFKEVEPVQFIERLNQDPGEFFKNLAQYEDDTIAVWLVELVEFSAKIDAKAPMIPVELTSVLKFSLINMEASRKNRILLRFYELYKDLYPYNNSPSRYEKILNEQLFN